MTAGHQETAVGQKAMPAAKQHGAACHGYESTTAGVPENRGAHSAPGQYPTIGELVQVDSNGGPIERTTPLAGGGSRLRRGSDRATGLVVDDSRAWLAHGRDPEIAGAQRGEWGRARDLRRSGRQP